MSKMEQKNIIFLKIRRTKKCIKKTEKYPQTRGVIQSGRRVVTDTFSGSGTQKTLPARPPVEHEATKGV